MARFGTNEAQSTRLHAVPSSPQRLLTAREVAALLSVSTATVYRLVERGVLPCVRVSNAIRFATTDLEAFRVKKGGGL